MVQYLTTFHDTFGLPILLTEFAEEVLVPLLWHLHTQNAGIDAHLATGL